MTSRNLDKWSEAKRLADQGAVFVISHSGGKDSQAMYLALRKVIPAEQIVVAYAKLGEGVVWEGLLEHVRETVSSPVIVADAVHADGAEKTFWTMVEARGKFPSDAARWCTSDLKTGPINREVRRLVNAGKLPKLVVMCLGLRAEESRNRANEAKTPTWKLEAKESVAGRTWYRWCPIKSWTAAEVFEEIAEAGQKPHWVYAAGMRRCSCCFCIYACREDLQTAAKLHPALYRRYVEAEHEKGYTLKREGALEAFTGLSVEAAEVAGARVAAGLEAAGVPVGLANPYGDRTLPQATEPCDDGSDEADEPAQLDLFAA